MALVATVASIGGLLACISLIGATAEAKTPGSTYCFYGKCHRVKSITETEQLVGTDETLSVSFYDSCKNDSYNPCGLTSSGEVFHPDTADNAASPIYPDGTKLLVWSPLTGEAAVLRVNNAGPYWGNRKLDVSRATAEILGFKGQGVATLKVRVIDAPGMAEATYVKHRKYDPVPGYIGRYASLDEASAAMASVMAADALAEAVPAARPVRRQAVAKLQAEMVSKTQSTMIAALEPQTKARTPKTARQKPVTTASLYIPVVNELIELTDSLLGIPGGKSKAVAVSSKPIASSTRPAAAQTPPATSATRVASVSAAPKAKQRVAAVKARRPPVAKQVAVAQAAKPAPKGPSVASAPNDMSFFSRHTHAGADRYVDRQRQAAVPQRTPRKPG